ncbi:MAG: DNA polymerase subunit beta [Methanobrevibacter sp.]|jgi:predicted nucleotidyltransferase|nr:DNA polymerase subunit beta [Candidatus Methanovirga meridionalis]
MKIRTRDFIYTKDDLFFATTNYIHPEDRVISFLRYIPDENGDRIKNSGRYSKVNSDEAYKYLKENHPEYLYFCNITNIEMMGVPINKIKTIIKPEERLKEIREHKENKFLHEKLIDLSDFFHYIGGIDYEKLGISGSILLNLEKNDISDLDFVVYGLNNHKKAIEIFKNYKDKEVELPNKTIVLNSIGDDFWDRLYDKRIKDSSLTKEDFSFYESRKNNRGVLDGTLFDILLTRDWNEIHGKWNDIKYEKIGEGKIEAKIKNDILSFDNPAVYEIEDLKILKGEDINITEIASFTHTYAGQAIDGEEIIAQGKIEKISENRKDRYRLVIGTTRESMNEFIKLKDR